MPRYRTTFTAAGRYPFPLDMLRYDGCYPADQAAVLALQGAVDGRAPRSLDTVFRIRLVSHHDSKLPDLTPDRWRSFGWEIPKAEWVTERAS